MGIIVLGKKISSDAYTKEDLELLETLANQASIAFEQAQLYSQMDEKIEEQTHNIKELLKTKSEFLNIASHQLRTPVSIIRGMLSMIQEGGLTPEQKQDFINKSYQAVNRLVTIINDILDAQEIAGEQGGLKIHPKPTQLEEIISQSVKMFQQPAQEKGLYLKFIPPSKPLPKLLIDPGKIRGALDDLIDNAIHYTRKGGVTIKTQILNLKGQKWVEIRIKDTGIGITKTELPHLFKKFSRGRGGKSLNVNSSGLGLFIVSHIIKAHHGTIKALSKGKDKGTTFVIRLPVEPL
jgi:signal transduction histidine kinase